ncbi:MAG TPA: Ig-like domain-containing protein [Gemmataceae bacterium]
MPLNWTQWNSDSDAQSAVTGSPNPALSGTKSLSVASGAGSGDVSRAWLNEMMPADVQVSADVYINTVIPAQVIARGSNLDMADGSDPTVSHPSFYAAQLSSAGPGPKLELVKDVNGTLSSLASINAPNYVQNEWLQETLDVEGATVGAQLYDPNAHEYLNSSGQWQSGQAWALTVIDASISGPGVVGVGRAAKYAGTIYFDDFSVQAPAADQSFDAASVGQLPDNWSKYSSNGSDVVAVDAPTSPITPPSGPNALRITAVGSGDVARAWLNNSLPADLSVSAYAYIAATPAQVFARGSNLNSPSPTYYAVEVWRGGGFKLVKVVGGVPTDLGPSVTSKSYIDNMWVQETLGLSGTTVEAQLYRPDTQQYMDSSGNWQSTPTWALTATDTSITGGGQAGVGRPVVPEYVDTNYFDDFTTAVGTDAQNFDASTGWPLGWSQSGSQFSVVAAPNNNFLSAYNVLQSTAGSGTSLIWDGNESLTNAEVSAGMYLPSGGTQVIARGTYLNTSAPNYYGLSVTPTVTGLVVDLVRVNNGGIPTELAKLSPLSTDATYFSSQWIQVTLYVDGTNVRAQIYRADTGQYLNSEDLWQSAPAYALDVNDTDPQALTGPGYGGLARPSGSGTVYFDNFSVTPLSVENTPPAFQVEQPLGTWTGNVTISVTPTGNFGLSKVDFYVEDIVPGSPPTILTHWEETTGPYDWDFDTTFVPNGTHTLLVQAYDDAGNVATATTSVTVSNNTTLTTPNITRHQSNIGIVELSYADPPNGSYDSTLLQNNDDVVVDGADNFPAPGGETYLQEELADIHSIASNVQQLIYTNVSNIATTALTAWLDYAEENGIDPELAFYHVSAATTWTGDAGSTRPVDYFWGVYAYQNGAWQGDLTANAHASPGTTSVAFGNGTSVVGDTLNVGYTDKFREIDINLSQARSGGSYVLEYPTAVDSNGNPTAWATLTTLSDTTNGLTTSGTITFDPPSNWVPAAVDSSQSETGTARLYYVRFRTTAAFSTIPVASTILGYNYTGAVSVNGTYQVTGTYTIPAFDYAADTNHDGYLNAQEYAHRAPGMDAYFAYQGRLFTGYGEMRFVTNPSSPAFRDWAVNQYYPQFVTNNPYANGLFVDNSEDNPAGEEGYSGGEGHNLVLEPIDSYTVDYASLLNAISRNLPAGGWIMANIDGSYSTPGSNGDGQSNVDPVIPKVQAYYEEKDIRALVENTKGFLGVYNQVYYRNTNDSPSYAVLDSGSLDGSTTSEEQDQTQLTTLAAYYLLAPTNPNQGALDFFGGEGTGTAWVKSWSPPPPLFNHWSPAAAYNVGTPVGPLPDPSQIPVIATGQESDQSTYTVYERAFTGSNGQPVLVLYKPVSVLPNGGSSTLTDSESATTVPLGGSYYVLQADGTLSSTAVTSISLYNGEGAILVQAGTDAPAMAAAPMVAAPILTSSAAATASTLSTSGASSVSQGSAGPTTAETFERLFPGLFAPHAAGAGHVPAGLPADSSGLSADLGYFFSLWTVAKMGTAFAGSNLQPGETGQAQMTTAAPLPNFGFWLGSTGLLKARDNNSPFDDSF